jgi:hypothetical protein
MAAWAGDEFELGTYLGCLGHGLAEDLDLEISE